MADDEGIIRWSPPYLKSIAFIYDDDIDVSRAEALADELAKAGLVFPYRGGKSQQRLAWIVNFRKHQRIDKPQASKLPFPSLQNTQVQAAYAQRDGWICALCGGRIPMAIYNDTAREICGHSVEHINPRIKGGTDAPSNIRSVHNACSKSRRDRDKFVVPQRLTEILAKLESGEIPCRFAEQTHSENHSKNSSATNSENHSKNSSATNSETEWNGMDQEKERIDPSSSSARAREELDQSPEDDSSSGDESAPEPEAEVPPDPPPALGAPTTRVVADTFDEFMRWAFDEWNRVAVPAGLPPVKGHHSFAFREQNAIMRNVPDFDGNVDQQREYVSQVIIACATSDWCRGLVEHDGSFPWSFLHAFEDPKRTSDLLNGRFVQRQRPARKREQEPRTVAEKLKAKAKRAAAKALAQAPPEIELTPIGDGYGREQ
jgi:hypothetical protein